MFNHDKIERNSILLLVLTVIVISIGGLVEIAPLFRMETTIEKVEGMRPYTPLELLGSKIYKREGCLQYSFVETLKVLHPLYITRALGGTFFLAGACLMAWNFWKTVNEEKEND
jgi:cbb3-type cytochrome c oxidase subunit II